MASDENENVQEEQYAGGYQPTEWASGMLITSERLNKIENELDRLSYAIDAAAYQFIGASDNTDGEPGYVPQPLIADKNKFLRGDGSWSDNGSALIELNASNISSGTINLDRLPNIPIEKIIATVTPEEDEGGSEEGGGEGGSDTPTPTITFDVSMLPVMKGSTDQEDGTAGIVPQPVKEKYAALLGSNGQWITLDNRMSIVDNVLKLNLSDIAAEEVAF